MRIKINLPLGHFETMGSKKDIHHSQIQTFKNGKLTNKAIVAEDGIISSIFKKSEDIETVLNTLKMTAEELKEYNPLRADFVQKTLDVFSAGAFSGIVV